MPRIDRRSAQSLEDPAQVHAQRLLHPLARSGCARAWRAPSRGSPTSFNILGQVFQTHNSWQAVLGLVLVLASGAMYSLAPQAAR